jgi:hypothetical protein
MVMVVTAVLLVRLVVVVTCAAIDVACAMGEECVTPSMTTHPLQGASHGMRAGRVAASIVLAGRRRQVRRTADRESLVGYIAVF